MVSGAHLGALNATNDLQHGQSVCHDLARVVIVSEAVDHGHARILGQLQQVLVCKQAGHDDVIVPADGDRLIREVLLPHLHTWHC